MNNKIVLQSVDSPRRDMEWRLFMAAKLAEKGIASVIGSKAAIRAIHARSKNCVFLGRLDSNTGRTKHDKKYLKEMEDKGTAMFFLHDEGGLYYKGEYEEWVRRIYPEEYFGNEVFKKILFWGEAQQKFFLKSPYKDKFKVTGFPRFDLCKPEFDSIDKAKVSTLNEKYGDFILICGRFAAVNMVADDPSSLGKRSFDIREEGGALETKTKEDVLRSMFGAWEKVSLEFSQFVPAVARLALDFPELNFVVRPHPAERESFYEDAFVHFDNIYIDKSGDVRPYIRACKAVVHSECTTGLEADINCKPNINFRPCADQKLPQKYEVAGASDIGIIVKNYNELQSVISELMEENFPFRKSDYSSKVLIENIMQEFYSSDYICRLIVDFFESNERKSKIDHEYHSYNYVAHAGMSFVKTSIKKVLGLIGFEKYKRLIVSEGDLKHYQFSESQIKTLWKALRTKNAELKQVKDIIYIDPSDK